MDQLVLRVLLEPQDLVGLRVRLVLKDLLVLLADQDHLVCLVLLVVQDPKGQLVLREIRVLLDHKALWELQEQTVHRALLVQLVLSGKREPKGRQALQGPRAELEPRVLQGQGGQWAL